mmetsp:Transcript_6394/g.9326  ORF Transcript_6394/g.9326 Transcript_6394/m.9326 type:complete len:107 (+) Transcript_6394:533-853(+)
MSYCRDNDTMDSLLLHILRDDAEFLHTPSMFHSLESIDVYLSLSVDKLYPILLFQALPIVTTLPLTHHIAQRIAAPTTILSAISIQGSASGIGLNPGFSAAGIETI